MPPRRWSRLKRRCGASAALLALVQGEVAGLVERDAETRAHNAALLEQARERNKLITEQTASVRALKLALTREQARRLLPGAVQGRPGR